VGFSHTAEHVLTGSVDMPTSKYILLDSF